MGVGGATTILDATVGVFVEPAGLPLPLPAGTAEAGFDPFFDWDRVDERLAGKADEILVDVTKTGKFAFRADGWQTVHVW